jgi:hypothetical protein
MRRTDFSGHDQTSQWRKLLLISLSQEVLPECNAPPQATCCALSRASVSGKGSDPRRAGVDLRNQCSYETLDVDDPERSDSAVVASAANPMRIELELG